MSLTEFLQIIQQGNAVSFEQSMAIIEQNYHYQATQFTNGLEHKVITNQAGTNEGSCKIFAFAKLNGLNEQQTLQLFGDYYQHVLATPDAQDHQNIRHFMQFGWSGISFASNPLSAIN